MRPAIAPTYVRRCPRITLSSLTPPSDTCTNLRPIAFAIDCATEVLPTPGAPTKQIICALTFLVKDITDNVSKIRSLTLSKA